NSFTDLLQRYQERFKGDFSVLKTLYGMKEQGSLRISNSGMNFINYHSDPSAFLFSPHSDLEACEGRTEYDRSERFCPDNTDVVPSASIQKFESEAIARSKIPSSDLYKIGEVTLGRLRRALVKHTRAGRYTWLYQELISGRYSDHTWVYGGAETHNIGEETVARTTGRYIGRDTGWSIRDAHAITVDKRRLHSAANVLTFDARGYLKIGTIMEPGDGCEVMVEGTRCWWSGTLEATKMGCCLYYEVLGVDFIPEEEVYQGTLYIHAGGFQQGNERQVRLYFIGNEGTLVEFDYQQLLKWANIKTWYDKSTGHRYTHDNNPVVRFYATLMDLAGSHGVLNNIENVVGSAYSTKFTGDDQNNLMIGRSGRNFFDARGGDDQIITGDQLDVVDAGPGNDTVMIKETDKGRNYVDGGDDYDRVSYTQSEKGVSVDLSRTLQDLDIGDAFVGVEEFELTPFSDRFVGNDDSQTVRPGKGDNQVWMRGGDDTVICEGGQTELWLEKGRNKAFLKSGAHVVHGGVGDDQVFFSGPSHTDHFIEGGGGRNQ
ncbi:MAG: hypothetical protein ACPG5T_06795, partial [Endozoicomonas sp.]